MEAGWLGEWGVVAGMQVLVVEVGEVLEELLWEVVLQEVVLIVEKVVL
jgi:hypothetical protein